VSLRCRRVESPVTGQRHYTTPKAYPQGRRPKEDGPHLVCWWSAESRPGVADRPWCRWIISWHLLSGQRPKMGKKNKSEVPNPNNVVNRDILQRLNFLYQASVYLESISRQSVGSANTGTGTSGSTSGPPAGSAAATKNADPPPTAPQSKAQRRKGDREQRKGRVIRASDIGQGYVRAMRLIAQKTTVKM
jgi:hypothetical protein